MRVFEIWEGIYHNNECGLTLPDEHFRIQGRPWRNFFGKALGTKLAKVCDGNVQHSFKRIRYNLSFEFLNWGSYWKLEVQGPFGLDLSSLGFGIRIFCAGLGEEGLHILVHMDAYSSTYWIFSWTAWICLILDKYLWTGVRGGDCIVHVLC